MRNIGLDILRIVAVLLVIGRHIDLPAHPSWLLDTWVRGGWVGVDLFFVLSGFLVSSLLFREYQRSGTVDIKRFLIRRGFKIYPAFWLFLLFSLPMKWLLQEQPSISQVMGELLFLQNYLGGVWSHTWSLAVEEHFYLGLALLVGCLLAGSREKPLRHIPAIFAAVAIFCLSMRLLNLLFLPEYTHRTFLFGTHLRIDSLMFGVLLSYLWNFQNLESRLARIPSVILLTSGILLLSPAFVFALETSKCVSVFGVILFYIGSGLLLVAAIRWKVSDSKSIRIIAGLGAASYSIYLWHMAVATWGFRFFTKLTGLDSYTLYLMNAVIGACVFGWLLNRLIENPILRLRDRLFASQTHAITTKTQSHDSVKIDEPIFERDTLAIPR